MQDLSERDKRELEKALNKTQGPKFAMIGMSGTGKSATGNALFGVGLPVSHTVACTKEFREVRLECVLRQGPAAGRKVELSSFDAPGLGEDVRKDPEYLRRYAEVLPSCDAILWVSAARNRAVALEQICLDSLRSFSSKMVFGLSQVDLVEPMNWPKSLPFPSKEQTENIAEIAQDRAERFSSVLGRTVQVIPYSATRGYELETLFRSLIDTCGLGRGWLFHGLKNFSYRDFLPQGLPEHIVNPSLRPKAPGFSIKDILQKTFRNEGEHNGGRV